MTIGERYSTNKPLVNSILTGMLYFLFCWSIDLSDTVKGFFSILMLFLPGWTFPLTTCYFNCNGTNPGSLRIQLHAILSVLIYHGSVWIFTAEGRIKYITVLAGFSGALLFLIVTKYLLGKEITWFQILVYSITSGAAFLCYEFGNRDGLFMGLAVFLWTMINGQLLNHEFRKHHNHVAHGLTGSTLR